MLTGGSWTSGRWRGASPRTLEAELKGDPPAFLVLDGISNALLGVDAGSPRRAAATLLALAALAQRLGLTLLLLEEAGWLPVWNAVPRGPLGAALRGPPPWPCFPWSGCCLGRPMGGR